MTKTITVTGATGNIGSLVVPALLEAGASVKALVRDPLKAEALRRQGVEVFEGSYGDAHAVAGAMQGADSVLIIAPPNPDAAEQNRTLIRAARASGDPHVVRISAIGAAVDAPTENGRLHHASDEELKASGLRYTILRPHFFMQNVMMSIPTIVENGQMYWGMGDGSLGMIDVRDIADSAVALLLHGGHEGETLTPTGPESITFHEAAKTLGGVLGRDVTYVAVPYEAVRQSLLELGWGEWAAQVMYDYSKAYAAGWGDFANDDVESVTGRPPRSFEQFAREVFAGAVPAVV